MKSLEERILMLPIELQYYIDEYNFEHRNKMKHVFHELEQYTKEENCDLSFCNNSNPSYKMYCVEMYYSYYRYCSCDCMVNGIDEMDTLYDYNQMFV
jgi:hypothetical protein